MYSTLTSPERPVKNEFDGLFLWTVIVVILVMGPLEVIIACAAFNGDLYSKIFAPASQQTISVSKNRRISANSDELAAPLEPATLARMVVEEHLATVRL
jgi:hypothetical protein